MHSNTGLIIIHVCNGQLGLIDRSTNPIQYNINFKLLPNLIRSFFLLKCITNSEERISNDTFPDLIWYGCYNIDGFFWDYFLSKSNRNRQLCECLWINHHQIRHLIICGWTRFIENLAAQTSNWLTFIDQMGYIYIYSISSIEFLALINQQWLEWVSRSHFHTSW